MKTKDLTSAAEELQAHLLPQVSFYLRVGWIKEHNGPELVVYYDEREPLPQGFVPFWWRGLAIRLQGALPPGVTPEAEISPDIVWFM